MKFGSVCSGIEAASCAWHPLGWQAEFLSEIEPFPCSVLAHHYPNVPHRGKPAADGPRYKALGNSMAVPVMHWIGRRIQAVDGLMRSVKAAA